MPSVNKIFHAQALQKECCFIKETTLNDKRRHFFDTIILVFSCDSVICLRPCIKNDFHKGFMMSFKDFSVSPFFKKQIIIHLFIYIISSLSSVFAAWDDYEKGRSAFERGDNRAAFSAFRSVQYSQTIPYLEKLHQERKSRALKDLTEKDLTSEQLSDLEKLLEDLKESPKCLVRIDFDLNTSLFYRTYLKDVEKASKKKPKHPPVLPKCINRSVYGNYLYASWIESRHGLTNIEALSNYSYAFNCGEIYAFQRFQEMSEAQRALFKNRKLYEETLAFLRLGEEGVFERMYELSKIYQKRFEETSDQNAHELSQKFLVRAAMRGNFLKAQQDVLAFSETDYSDDFIAGDASIREFPSFSEDSKEDSDDDAKAKEESLLSHKTSSKKSDSKPSQERGDLFFNNMTLAAYAAENGDWLSAFCLGQYYEGEKTNTAFAKACFWYHESVRLGYTKAFIALGKLHETRGKAEDQSLAKQYYQKAAESQDPQGMYNVAIMASRDSNVKEAEYWLKKSSELYFANSYVKLAELYTNNPEFENYKKATQLMREFLASSALKDLAIPDVRKSADNALAVLIEKQYLSEKEEGKILKFSRFFSFGETLVKFGERYLSLRERATDESQQELLSREAFNAFLMASETGILSAKEQLSELTLSVRPEKKKDALKAKQIFIDLTKSKTPYESYLGHLTLALGYKEGAGIFKKNGKESLLHYECLFNFYTTSPDTFSPQLTYHCFFNLGYFYMSGEEVSGRLPNYKKALEFTQRACSFSPEGAPYAEAYYNLSRFFLHGYGTDIDLKKTHEYLRIASGEESPVFPREGDLDAHYDLGFLYLIGNEHTKKNEEMAEKLLMKAANAGVTKAYLALGKLYLESKNVEKAIEMLEQGVHNHIECILVLAFIYSNKPYDIDKARHYIQLAKERGLTDDQIEKAFQPLITQSLVSEEETTSEMTSSAVAVAQSDSLPRSAEVDPMNDDIPESFTQPSPALKTAKPMHSSVAAERDSLTRADRLIQQLHATKITATTKWKEVERILSDLVKLQGGSIKPGSGSVRHFQIGEIQRSMHEIHGRKEIGHGRARSLSALVKDALKSNLK